MAFFEDLGKKITQTSQGVVQKTKDTAEVIKLNGMISEEEKRIDSFHKQIGKMYFEMHTDSYESAFESMIIGIKESQSKIGQYSEQVKKLKGIVRCPNCGGDVPYGMPYCSSCGLKMDIQNASGSDIDLVCCIKCGMPIEYGCAFCTHCGAKVEPQQGTTVKVEHVLVSSNSCPNCGADVGENAFCTNCGSKIEMPSTTYENIEEPVVEQNITRLCPNCGNQETDAESVFCVNCGHKL